MDSFTVEVIRVIRSIPKGKVMTYGQISAAAGRARGARQVSRILHSMSQKYELPWHRVLSADGKLKIRDEETRNEQMERLYEEGLEVQNGRVNLEEYRYEPR
ncbi:methylated-DNA-protein-cysteine methyltransferase related protein [Terribacillus aidingensis]|uniref:Methylated-DNA-protein-cysteine methyltransferase related protein n=1 Tax=Terribacillus aidingensis TaxID=586416 RepID=A0A285NY90_9BACI|nr:MGMT family protein [Terribacillus aidingensis]SNZ14450.1 methylated-DNA-protein-cysteine methyltransferase related protein [Terribacillus aidingensis]